VLDLNEADSLLSLLAGTPRHTISNPLMGAVPVTNLS
jgi:hypothetical protein